MLVECRRTKAGVNHYCDGLTIPQLLKIDGKDVYKEISGRFNNGV